MIRKIIPILLPVVALVGGAFAGDMLRSPSADSATAEHEASGGDHSAPEDMHGEKAGPEKADQGHDATPKDSGHGKVAASGHDDQAASDHGGDVHAAAPGEAAWFTFPTQFFVPLMRQGDLRDMMILTLTLQTDGGSLGALGKKEHVLRDGLLRQLMIHANTGGFDGNFTADRNLAVLRESLLTAAQEVTDLPLSAVLIEDIARQPG